MEPQATLTVSNHGTAGEAQVGLRTRLGAVPCQVQPLPSSRPFSLCSSLPTVLLPLSLANLLVTQIPAVTAGTTTSVAHNARSLAVCGPFAWCHHKEPLGPLSTQRGIPALLHQLASRLPAAHPSSATAKSSRQLRAPLSPPPSRQPPSAAISSSASLRTTRAAIAAVLDSPLHPLHPLCSSLLRRAFPVGVTDRAGVASQPEPSCIHILVRRISIPYPHHHHHHHHHSIRGPTLHHCLRRPSFTTLATCCNCRRPRNNNSSSRRLRSSSCRAEPCTSSTTCLQLSARTAITRAPRMATSTGAHLSPAVSDSRLSSQIAG
jgi:hypothetical protein